MDLTITTVSHAPHSGAHSKTSEVVHTNQKHPFMTLEKGFLSVAQITIGMHVLRADGQIGVITAWKSVPGTHVIYNLEVAQDHTFTVGVGEWVVHNCARLVPDIFERYGSKAELLAAQADDALSFKRGTRGPDGGTKWVVPKTVGRFREKRIEKKAAANQH